MEDRTDNQDVAATLGGVRGEDTRLSPLRELQLVDAAREGDAAALATLLRGYQRRIHAVCYRMLRHEEEARDLAQDSMVKVMEGIASYDGRAKLSTWVYRVTTNCCLSHIRKRKLRQHGSLDDAIAASGEDGGPSTLTRREQLAGDREPSGEACVELGERRAMLEKALESLDPEMRAVIVLRDMHDLDYQQIAEVVEIPLGTVKSRLYRAREAIREVMQRWEDGQTRPELGTESA